MIDNLQLTRALHEKQAAYEEMAAAREKMSSLQQTLSSKYEETEELQAELDRIGSEKDKKWEDYNSRQLDLKEQIAQKILGVKECNILEENFRLMADNPDEVPIKCEVYLGAAKYLSGAAMQLMIDRDKLIAAKRAIPRPDNHLFDQTLSLLKDARREHDEIREEYYHAKNEFNMKKQNFDRLNERYNKLRGDDNSPTTFTNRPEKLEYDESLLVKTNIPKEYWKTCNMKKRTDGRIDIIYGADEQHRHGHVVLLNGKIEFERSPELIPSVLCD